MSRCVASAALLGLLALGGCVVESVNPYPVLPPPRVEAVPPPPSAVVVWEPGHYHWNGVGYVWIPGHYVTRMAGMHRWVHGHWANRGGPWVWVPGHWV